MPDGRGIVDKPNLEYHELIDDLTARKFYGNITLYFQAGVIDHNEIVERNTAKEIKEKMSAKKNRSVLHISSKKGEENGKAKHIQES
jgi:ArsR family metal-binding transcriptional regulator